VSCRDKVKRKNHPNMTKNGAGGGARKGRETRIQTERVINKVAALV
jgi:hypothetical protein